ncbi:hypothetical protein [Actinomadura harenae]|uniref:Uncharacterized protein n=1 Tax=Actinomadura harenae TaxID=2483351 RepID=A0A3M2MDR5_9ACTN|nr:hypothetical protein [Actinomadura harenae]RMI47606.1 hypothetical protein EBO15_01510 [Actinomadura harenae]
MPSYTYGGDVVQTYPQYLDRGTGRTLVAEPGLTYDVDQVIDSVAAPSGGREPLRLPMPPDDRWTPATPVQTTTTSASSKKEGSA